MRTNVHGLGAEITLQGPELFVPYLHTTTTAGLGQSVAPTVLGMGTKESADLLRITWPDGVMQCELNLDADQRKSSPNTTARPAVARCSSPSTASGSSVSATSWAAAVWATWSRLESTPEPDRDEAVAIRAINCRPSTACIGSRVTEPMDEVAYVDKLTLEVIDRPPGLDVAAGGTVRSWGEPSQRRARWPGATRINPSKATDLLARTWATLSTTGSPHGRWLRAAGSWIGYTEEHGIVLDFGDRLAGFGPDDRLVLGLQGWVEYPYSQTNYAAATAGVALQPPVLERLRDDGTWEVLEADPGYPAGLPRLDAVGADRQARWRALRAAAEDQHGVLLGRSLHCRGGTRGRPASDGPGSRRRPS